MWDSPSGACCLVRDVLLSLLAHTTLVALALLVAASRPKPLEIERLTLPESVVVTRLEVHVDSGPPHSPGPPPIIPQQAPSTPRARLTSPSQLPRKNRKARARDALRMTQAAPARTAKTRITGNSSNHQEEPQVELQGNLRGEPETSEQQTGLPTASAGLPWRESRPTPLYPAAARSRRLQGEVRVALQTDSEGRVRSVEVIKSSGYAILDRAAAEGVRGWRLRPEARLEVPILFRLTSSR